MKKKIRIISLTALVFPVLTFASISNGTILTPYAWGENTGWVNFMPTGGNIKVTDTAITGNAWDANYGWINLAPAQGGVVNDGNGNLSGYAWSTGGGYINFYGVVIDSHGKFTGSANGALYGQLIFDCNHCSVTTDWIPINARPPAINNGAPGGSSGSAGSLNNTIPTPRNQIVYPDGKVVYLDNPDTSVTTVTTVTTNTTENLPSSQGSSESPATTPSASSQGSSGSSSGVFSNQPPTITPTTPSSAIGSEKNSQSAQKNALLSDQELGKRVAFVTLLGLVALIVLKFIVFRI